MSDSFRTIIEFEKQFPSLNHHSQCLMVGSCFSENIAEKLQYHGFSTHFNPFGILYNAHSLNKCLNYIASSQTIEEKDLIFHDDLWHSKWHHGQFSNVSKEQVIKDCNINLKTVQEALTHTNNIFITIGTAFTYVLKSTGEVVGNCHKLPKKEFSKSMMSKDEVVNYLSESMDKILKINPGVNFIYTISPIRHLKDGFIENNLSKATLILAVHELKKKYTQTFYFPAYEIMMDDLRDYRFYGKDLLHPNPQAIEYIWQIFKDKFIEKSAYALMDEILSLKKAKAHKALHPGSPKHLAFLKKLELKIKTFQEKHPHIKLF